jgi:hypothetical protein
MAFDSFFELDDEGAMHADDCLSKLQAPDNSMTTADWQT